MPVYEYRTSGVPLAYSACAYRVSLSYKPYVQIRTKFLSMLKKCFCLARPCRMPAYTIICDRAWNVCQRIYQRVSDIFHTLTYAQWRNRGVFGCSVAGGPQAWGSPDKNDHKIFASTLGKLVLASVIEGQKICNRPPPKAGIGKI
jgi:hypothetical protein